MLEKFYHEKTLIIIFCILLIINVIYAIKYLDSIRQECVVAYVNGDCFPDLITG